MLLPCKTPYKSVTLSDSVFHCYGAYFSNKKNNKFEPGQNTPMFHTNIPVNLAWSMVSRAAVKLRKVRAVTSPFSILNNDIVMYSCRADSVLNFN